MSSIQTNESGYLGAVTNRDAWVFNSSSEKLRDLVGQQVPFYNKQVEALQDGADAAFTRDPSQFKWDGSAKQRARRGMFKRGSTGS